MGVAVVLRFNGLRGGRATILVKGNFPIINSIEISIRICAKIKHIYEVVIVWSIFSSMSPVFLENQKRKVLFRFARSAKFHDVFNFVGF